MKEFVTHGQAETEQVGRQLGSELEAPAILLLSGDLGAGKTVFTRGVARGLGIEDTSLVRSPTFTLVNQYPVPGATLYHVDLYRLDSARDIESIGLEDMLQEKTAIVLIEWGEKLPFPLTAALRVEIDVVKSDHTRRIRIGDAPAPGR